MGLIGSGSIGQAIVRRISAGKKLLVADLRAENAEAATRILSDAGFDITTATADVSRPLSVLCSALALCLDVWSR